MYVVAGASGQVGRATAQSLLAKGQSVRALVLTDAERDEWIALGQQAVAVEFHDRALLTSQFSDADGIFLMIPPDYNAGPDYSKARRIVANFAAAVRLARPRRVVGLSSIGGHLCERLGLIEQSHIFETEFSSLDVPTSFIRPAWFMENAYWQLSEAIKCGVLESYLHPLDRKTPMTATSDIGGAIADLLLDRSGLDRVVEIEGPNRYSPDDVALELSSLLSRPVRARSVARDTWPERFRQEGSTETAQRVAMLDGFNSGWIDFEGSPIEKKVGETPLRTVLEQLVQRIGRS
jgi:uncharacterized protein YbjT (DUF2867 family)